MGLVSSSKIEGSCSGSMVYDSPIIEFFIPIYQNILSVLLNHRCQCATDNRLLTTLGVNNIPNEPPPTIQSERVYSNHFVRA